MKKIHTDKIHNIPKIVIEGSVFENQYGEYIQHILGTDYFEILSGSFTNNSTVIWNESNIYIVRAVPPLKKILNYLEKILEL